MLVRRKDHPPHNNNNTTIYDLLQRNYISVE